MPASRPTRRRCCSSRWTACRRSWTMPSSGSRSIGQAHGARTVRVAGRRGRAATAVEGPQVGVRRGRADRARLLPPRHGRAAHVAWSRCSGEVDEIAERHGLHRAERLPRRRRQPASAAVVRSRASPACSTGARRGGGDRAGFDRRRRRAVGRARHRHREARLHAELFTADDLDAQARLREAFDPDGAANPGKVLPAGSRCGELPRIPAGPVGVKQLDVSVRRRERRAASTPCGAGRSRSLGGRTQFDVGGAPVRPASVRSASRIVVEYEPSEMTVPRRCGDDRGRARRCARPSTGSASPCPTADGATVGGVLAVGHSGIRRLGWGPVRDTVLEVRYVSADGRLIKGGGPTVKNVSGYDVPRCSSARSARWGSSPRSSCAPVRSRRCERWFGGETDPFALGAPAAPTGVRPVGRHDDVGAARRTSRRCRRAGAAAGLAETDGPPPSLSALAHRWSCRHRNPVVAVRRSRAVPRRSRRRRRAPRRGAAPASARAGRRRAAQRG